MANENEQKQYAMVGELCTDRHDTQEISIFLMQLRSMYQKFYSASNLYFRLICLDNCWASIHSFLSILNQETIEDYAIRVFKLAKGSIKANESKLSWLCSCISHTMHRFIKSIKLHITQDENVKVKKNFFG